MVEKPEEPSEHRVQKPGKTVLLLVPGLEHDRGQRRAERQGIKGRQKRRKRNRQRELAIELPSDSADEGDGNEDGRKSEGNRDDRARDLVHRLECRGPRRVPALDPSLHVLHDDDGIIDDDADRKHHPEQAKGC